MTAFVAAAVTLIGLVFTAALTVAGAQEKTLRTIKSQTLAIKRWGGWILIGVGIWFVLLAVFADFFAGVLPV